MSKYLIHRINYFLFFILFSFTTSHSFAGNSINGPETITFSGGSTYCQNSSSLDLLAEITTGKLCGSGSSLSVSHTITIYSNTINSTGIIGRTLVTSCSDQLTCSFIPPTSTCGDLYYYAIVSWSTLDCLSNGSITSSTTLVTTDCDATCTAKSSTSGIIINEFSNGDSGDREFIEFLVIGTPCTTVDLRGWIFDDNNGLDDAICQGFGKNFTSVGIAAGHARFRSIARWASVPVGSLIVVYNGTDKNISITAADDPSDLLNPDKVYILPINDSGFEQLTSNPISSGDCSYTTGTYSSPASWGPIGLRNTGDACQTRSPDGRYFHGFSYGITSANMTGGPDNLYFNINGTQKNFYLNCGHHSFIADYSTGDGDFSDGSSDETPGLPNNSLNQSYIDYYIGTDGCGVKDACVVALSNNNIKLKGNQTNKSNRIYWFDGERIAEKYSLQRSSDGINFKEIAILNKNDSYSYEFNDYSTSIINYYQLIIYELNGHITNSNTIVIKKENTNSAFAVKDIFPNPANNEFGFNLDILRKNEVRFSIYNVLGKEVIRQSIKHSGMINVNTSNFSNGVYQMVFYDGIYSESYKLLVNH